MDWGKEFRTSYFISPREYILFFQRWMLISCVLCFLAMKALDPGHMDHNKWHRVLGYTHAIEGMTSTPGRFIFLPMWTYGVHFVIAGVRLSLQRSAIEGRLTTFQMNLKYAVGGLWVSSVCVFPLMAAFDQQHVQLATTLYTVYALSFHLYGWFEYLEYRPKGSCCSRFALWMMFRFVLNGSMLAMMIYDNWAFAQQGEDGHFEPPVPPLLLQLTEYSIYLTMPLTEWLLPEADSMEVHTNVTSGTIAKDVGPVPVAPTGEFGQVSVLHALSSDGAPAHERGVPLRSESEDCSQELLSAAVSSQTRWSHAMSSRPFTSRQTTSRPAYRRSLSMRTPGGFYDAIVFEGGGTKGTAYAGAVKRLEEKGLMESIRKFGGTSAGAQTAVLVAVGYTGDELAEIARHTPWHQVFDMDKGCAWALKAIWRVKTRFGACRGEFLLKYLEALIARKVGQPWITFQQFYDLSGIDLHLGVSNLTLGAFQFLTKETHGEMPLALGAMASSSIPFVFPPVRWGGEMYADGGVGGNLPTKAFPGARLLACKLQTASDGEELDLEAFSGYVAGVTDLIFSCAQSVGGQCEDKKAKARETARRREYTKGIHVDIVHVACGDCGVVETTMPLERINKVIDLGYESMTQFLDDSLSTEGAEEDASVNLILGE